MKIRTLSRSLVGLVLAAGGSASAGTLITAPFPADRTVVVIPATK